MKKGNEGGHVFDYIKTGRDCFYNLVGTVHGNLGKTNSLIGAATSKTILQNSSDLQPYLGMIGVILRHIDGYEGIIDKEFYISILKANLSGYEIVLLNYAMFSDVIDDDFKTLISKYNLLSSLDPKKVKSKDYIYANKKEHTHNGQLETYT